MRPQGRAPGPLPATLIKDLDAAHFNRSLTRTELADIRDCAKNIEHRYFYSTLAAPLALCQVVRSAQESSDGSTSFRTALEAFAPTAKHLLNVYHGGTCFSLAEEIRDVLRDTLGVHALIVAESKPFNVLTDWPSPHGENQPYHAAFDRMAGATHVDLIIPTLAPDKRPCMVHIPCGQGPAAISDELSILLPNAFQGTTAPSSSQLEALSVATIHKPLMFSRNQNFIFGIDLLRGYAYINRALAAYTTHTSDSDKNLLTYSFKSSDFDADEMMLFVEAVRCAFSLPRSFSQDVLFLMGNHEHYLKDVLLPRARTLASCVDQMLTNQSLLACLSRLMPAMRLDKATPTAELFSQGQQRANDAAHCVENEDGPKAAILYQEALNSFNECRNLVVEHLIQLAQDEPKSLLGLDRDALGGLPDDVLQRIANTVIRSSSTDIARSVFHGLGPKLLARMDKDNPIVIAELQQWESTLGRSVQEW